MDGTKRHKILHSEAKNGTRDGDRTRTSFLKADFKSAALSVKNFILPFFIRLTP